VRFGPVPVVAGAATVDSAMAGLRFIDDDGTEVRLDLFEARALLAITHDLEPATVSACPDCRSRVVAAVALVDLLDASPPHPRAGELVDLADEAPTLHLYVVDDVSECPHARWRDPGANEWHDAVDDAGPRMTR
jgi:hypothetical protein